MNLDSLKKRPRKSPLLPGLLVLLLAPIMAGYAAEQTGEAKHESRNEVEGIVQTMPKGQIGSWKIGDRQVTTDAKTQFDEQECPIKVGANVEAQGQLQGQSLIASKIECEGPEESEDQEQDD